MAESGRDRFLQYLLAGPEIADPQRWLYDGGENGRSFAAACFLADSRPPFDLLRFTGELLPLLLRQLHRSTRRERVTYQGQIRGRVDWPATYKARMQNEVNPALFVCRPPLRSADTPQNQLLKFLLEQILALLQELEPLLLQAEVWTAVSGQPQQTLGRRLSQITFHTRRALGNVRLRAVETPGVVTARHLMQARTSKAELYGVIAELYRQYETAVLRRNWHAIYPILGHTLLLPAPDTPAGEQILRLNAAGFLQARQSHGIIAGRGDA